MGLTLDEVRPLILGFEDRRYTNPTMMQGALRRLGAKWSNPAPVIWPIHGLVRIQWEGPWTKPGVPARVAYRHTHWVAARTVVKPRFSIGVFDINAMNSGGWIPLKEWGEVLVPWLLQECEPKATGRWWLTHVYEIERK